MLRRCTGRNTLQSRRVPGGSLRIVAGKAPRNLRRMNVRVLLVDECDALEPSNEGDPLTLATRRTMSFPNRKIILGSTPVYENGNVLRSYATSDQRVFEVPCPECGSFSHTLEPRFYDEIASERLVVRYVRGQPTRIWERKVGVRAESLDALCYAIAVRGLVNADLERREAELSTGRPSPAAMPVVVKSAWLRR